MFSNIPSEMHAFPHWLVWRLVERDNAKPTKVPYNPFKDQPASVTDPNDWVSFKDAIDAAKQYSGIGFVFNPANPFGGIDLDDTHGDQANWQRQLQIFKEFDSYSELSPSGTGLHIIVKGKVPHGRRRAAIEVYSSERYFTMTGNVYHPKPIVERQELLTSLWEQMGGAPVLYNYEEQDEKQTDTEILKIATEAINGEKFVSLLSGEWNNSYPSQSEADFALIDILGFYTQNRAQIARIFRASKLGQRAKANRADYVNYMITKSFDRQLPQVDIDGLRINGEKISFESTGAKPSNPAPVPASSELSSAKPPTTTRDSQPFTARFPPGLVGEVAQFIYEASPRPVAEISLAGSIALLAGITGRAYNISGTGLNQYIMVVANTGAGKDILSHGPSQLMNYIRNSVAASAEFIGPGELVSSAGLIKHLAKNPSFVSTIGEFGKKLKEMSNPKSNSHLSSVLRLFLQLYSKSGYGNVLDPIVYSDTAKNTNPIYSPSLTILGEGTPESFYGNLDENMIADGLLPRFMIIEYKGKNPYLSETHHLAKPSFALVEHLASVATECLARQKMGEPRLVQLDAEAEKIFKDFGKFATDKVNETKLEVTRQLWNRAHIKALKLAGLISVGINYLFPIVTINEANYSINMIVTEVESMIERFANGDVGIMTSHNIDEYKQVKELGRVIAEWTAPKNESYNRYKITPQMKADNIILYNALQMRLFVNPNFKNDKYGATAALKKALQYFLDADDIAEVPRGQMKDRYKTTAKAYVITNMRRFDEYVKPNNT